MTEGQSGSGVMANCSVKEARKSFKQISMSKIIHQPATLRMSTDIP
jgi:hypothetical protein